MSTIMNTYRSITACPNCYRAPRQVYLQTRKATTSAVETSSQSPSSPPFSLEPHTVDSARLERKLLREKSLTPIGSRRKRALLRQGEGVPFHQQPYQCFQEARQYLVADRARKIDAINVQRERLAKMRSKALASTEDQTLQRSIKSMESNLENLKILADINDPMVKKRFEDGKGDMSKPIYRHLSERKWQSYQKKILDQRIEQMHLVPDLLPNIDVTASLDVYFGRQHIEPGAHVNSLQSVTAPRLQVQVFNRGERLVTVAVVNPDVPDVANDTFVSRCHFLASNISLSPTETSINLQRLAADVQLILPWTPAYAQKGAPYQRMAIFILEQPHGTQVDISAATEREKAEGFNLRSFVDRHSLTPTSASLFRTQWDDNTARVMQQLGVPGHDVEFKRKKVEPLPYKRLPGSRFR